MRRRIDHARNLVDKVESKCKLTPSNLKITVASHVFSHAGVCMHANPGIDERGYSVYISRGSGGVLQKNFEIFMPRESF